jgi:16S rRNA (cytosine967-C5)-methyltransferase
MHVASQDRPLAEARARQNPPPQVAGASARAAAAGVLDAVRHRGRSLSDALTAPQVLALADGRDRALVQELSYGALRLLPRLEALAASLMHKPVKAADHDLDALVLIGLYQLVATRIPAHAAVAATVAAAKTPGRPWAAGLVNALLRRYEREGAALDARIAETPLVRWLFPEWLLHRLQAAWPDHWAAICDASNAHPPMTLRVNRLRTDRHAYAELLAAAGIASRPLPHADMALRLDTPVATSRLPGFDAGLVSVQDAGAQLAAALLAARPGERVLDACAAPGGKTAHLLELAGNDLDLTAVDLDTQRLGRVTQGLTRLGLHARTRAGDAANPQGDWAGGQYQRILVDVPCSATGVIRRHPDIKWLRRDTDIAQLAALQGRILDAVWPLLAPGGTLLYATCSLLPEENEDQITAFLSRTADAALSPIAAHWGLARGPGRQILPQPGGMDGFFYARVEKAAP